MNAVRFPEANVVMRGEGCFDIHALVDGGQVVTAWRPSPEELVKINLGEPVWLVLWGRTMQPALVTADCPFVEAPAIEL
jgi:hypothetical protein